MRAMVFLVLTAGCTPGEAITDSLIAEYEARLNGVRVVTQTYVDEVDAAGDLADIPPAQTSYMGAMEVELTELDHALEGFHDCGMMGDSEARVGRARAAAAIEALVEGLPEVHGAHSDLVECGVVAGDLLTEMGSHMGNLEDHSSSWASNMSCMGHEGDEEHPGHID